MLRSATVVRLNALVRPIRQMNMSRRSSQRAFLSSRSSTIDGGGCISSSSLGCTSAHQRCSSHPLHAPSSSLLSYPSDTTHRHLSAGLNGLNGASPSHRPPGGEDLVESSAATARWKRDHYRKIEERFSPAAEAGDGTASAEKDDDATAAAATTTRTTPTSQQQWDSPPLAIDDYDDVQPMWKEMESRVTRRRSLTHAQRGGVSGRRNVRRSDEDVWLEAGVYDSEEPKKD